VKYKVKFRPEAVVEFNQSTDWYEARQNGLGQKFIASIDSAIKTILASPTRFRCIYKEVRLLSVKGFPYQIYYRVLDDDKVEVLSVFHVRQNPEIWRRRG